MDIPQNAGLGDLRNLLAEAENQLREWRPKLTKYRQEFRVAKTDYDFELACAKVKFQDEGSPTLINAKAAMTARPAQLQFRAAEANLIMAEDRVKGLEGERDTIKCMIKSEHLSY